MHFINILFILTFITTASFLTITACNCSRPIVKGDIDLSEAKYCTKKPNIIPSKPITYKFLKRKSAYLEFIGYECTSWENAKEIVTTLADVPDTKFYTNLKPVVPLACLQMVMPPHICNGNIMEEEGNTFKYILKPTGDYVHWGTAKYALYCLAQKVLLKQECPTCPVLAPIGALNTSIETKYVFLTMLLSCGLSHIFSLLIVMKPYLSKKETGPYSK